MTPEEQTYMAAREQMHQAIAAFRNLPQIQTYLASKANLIAAYLHERYPDITFEIEVVNPQWDATLENANLALDIHLELINAHQGQAIIIEQEIKTYVASLGDEREFVHHILSQA